MFVVFWFVSLTRNTGKTEEKKIPLPVFLINMNNMNIYHGIEDEGTLNDGLCFLVYRFKRDLLVSCVLIHSTIDKYYNSTEYISTLSAGGFDSLPILFLSLVRFDGMVNCTHSVECFFFLHLLAWRFKRNPPSSCVLTHIHSTKYDNSTEDEPTLTCGLYLLLLVA